jgi:dTDP-4-amino-4,6-dideoxygalactose transaminase
VTVVAAGINGKMSEINAAFGLLQLKGIDEALAKRQAIDAHYRESLKDIVGIRCADGGSHVANYAYFPIFVEKNRDALYETLKENGIFGRRYFYPLISDFTMYRSLPSASPSNLPVARNIAQEVICLPIYPELSPDSQDKIINLILEHK